MRKTFYGKLCVTTASVAALMFFYTSVINSRSISNQFCPTSVKKTDKTEENTNLKYILQWTSPDSVPFVYMGAGQQGFIERNCEYQNCYVTSDREYLADYTSFDVIAFAAQEVSQMSDSHFPINRSAHQKYVFASIESADNYPVCDNYLDGYFNWTWTYRLDSDSRWGYIIVRDINGTVIGPHREMNWIKPEDMKPVSEDMKNLFKGKSKAATWFVSNCITRSNRETLGEDLKIELNKLNQQLDIYGSCKKNQCSRDNETACDEMIERDYFFYLSFENSFDEDYVTEKLLRALENKAIPVVYGEANYSRFMPDGAYLNAMDLQAKELAEKMNELINDIDKYAEYFKWTNHYRYHRKSASVETDDYCGFCALLNNEDAVNKISVYERFGDWWNPLGRCGGNMEATSN